MSKTTSKKATGRVASEMLEIATLLSKHGLLSKNDIAEVRVFCEAPRVSKTPAKP